MRPTSAAALLICVLASCGEDGTVQSAGHGIPRGPEKYPRPTPSRGRVEGALPPIQNSDYDEALPQDTTGGRWGYALRERWDQRVTGELSFREASAFLGTYDVVAGWGLTWVDADGDGDDDLFVANHMHYPSALYVNEEGVSFRRLETSLDHDIWLDDHMGAFADFDGDGRVDLYTANGFYRPDHLFRNEGELEFREVGPDAGLPRTENGRGRSALWADFDGNGWNDLYVLNLRTPDRLYLNSEGTLRDTDQDSGLVNSLAKEGAVFGDLDGDADLDVYLPVLRGGQANLLFLNRGFGELVECSEGSGADLEGASHAAALGDADNDGDLDLIVASTAELPAAFLRNRGDATFELASEEVGIGPETGGALSLLFADFQNDGWLDLFVSCVGELDGPGRANALLLNRRDGTFRNATAEAGLLGVAPGRTSSVSVADWNLDGALDLALTNGADPMTISGQHLLYRNDGPVGRWIRVHAPAWPGNTDGIGAHVTVRLPDGSSYSRQAGLVQTLAQNAEGTHLGLGENDHALQITVAWPDGRFAQRQGVPADQRVSIPGEEEPTFARSHPAALLGEVPLTPLPSALPAAPTPVDEIAERLDEVRAWALAQRIADGVEVDDARLARAYEERRGRFALPARRYVEQIALGPFTSRGQQPRYLLDTAEAAFDGLVAGRDVQELARELDVRAWARVFKKGSDYQPELGAVDTTKRGYVECGWFSEAMLRERYGEVADVLVEMEPGEVYGPVAVHEGRDVQDPRTVWPVLRVLRVLAEEDELQLELEHVRDDLERAARREELLAGLRRAAGDDWSPTSARSAEPVIGFDGLWLPVAPLAAAAGEDAGLGSDRWAEILGRVIREVEHDTALRRQLDEEGVGSGEFERRAASMREHRTSPEALWALRIVMPEAEALRQLRDALPSGNLRVEAMLPEHGVPRLDTRDARSTKSYFEENMYTRALLRRVVSGEDAGEAIDGLMALGGGDVSEILPCVDGFQVFVVVQRSSFFGVSAAPAYRAVRRERLSRIGDSVLE